MGHLVWCSSCTERKPVETTDLGLICCIYCGKVIDEDICSNDSTFPKNSAGQNQLNEKLVRSVRAENPVSQEKTFYRAEKVQHEPVDGIGEESGKADYMSIEGDESENLSDIDDNEGHQQKRAAEAKNVKITAAEAAYQMLPKKQVIPDNPKKKPT